MPPSSASMPVTSSYNGPLHNQRPGAGVTTVQKRRFRTQSSTVDQNSRRTTNTSPTSRAAAATTVATASSDAHVVAMHTCPVPMQKPDKGSSNTAVRGEANGGSRGGDQRSSRTSNNINSAHKANPRDKSEASMVLPKITSGTVQFNIARTQRTSNAPPTERSTAENTKGLSARTDGGAQGDPSAFTPSASSSVFASTNSLHLIKKQNRSLLNCTAPPTRVSVKDLTSSEPPPISLALEKEADVAHLPYPVAPSPSSKRRMSDTASPITVSDAAGLKSTGNIISPSSAPPPRQLSRRDSVTFSSVPPAAPLPLSSPMSMPIKKYEDIATTPTSLRPLRDSFRVNEGNSEAVSEQQSKRANAESATPPARRRDSALPCNAHCLAQASLTVNKAPSATVTLPRVSPPLSAQQMPSLQLSSTNPQRAIVTPQLQSSVDSAGADALCGMPPSAQSPRSSISTQLQPHPLTTLHRTSSTSSNGPVHTLTARKDKPPSTHPSRHASQLKNSPSDGAATFTSKTGHDTLLPAIVHLFSFPIPLRNFGATCYLNSVVQCLLFTPGLLLTLDRHRQRIIREWEDKKGCRFDEAHRRSCAERNAPATSALLDLGTAQPTQDTPTAQLLLSLKAACGECNEEFVGNGQNDAHEFLITLLGVIDKEVCRSKPEAYQTMKDVEGECKCDAYARWMERLRRENDSTIYDFFGGVTSSTVQCATCALISYRFEAQLDISLPMAYNSGPRATARPGAKKDNNGKARPKEVVAVDLLLREMFFSDRGEYLSGPMQVTCDRCKKLRDKTIWSTIEQWPPILVLHLKRFNNAGVKNEAAVIFPYTFCFFGRVKYQLYGVCCHRGTASFGHYTSYVYADGDATAAGMWQHSRNNNAGGVITAASRVGDRAEEAVTAFCAPFSGSFAHSAGHNFGPYNECDLSTWKNVTQVRVSGSSGSNGGSGGNDGVKAGKWYFCNDESITTVSACEVVSKTKDAYILFYRRVT